MQPFKIGTLVLWVLQFLFGIIVVALSADKVRKQVFEGAPVTDRYSVFAGAFGMIVCGLGVLGAFISLIPDIVILVADGLSSVIYLAGGIAYSIGLRGNNCGANISSDTFQKMIENELINLGSMTVDDKTAYGFAIGGDGWENVLRDTCKRALADQTIQYLAFAVALATTGLTYWMKNRKSTAAYV